MADHVWSTQLSGWSRVPRGIPAKHEEHQQDASANGGPRNWSKYRIISSNLVSISHRNHDYKIEQVVRVFQDYSASEIGLGGAWDNAGYPGEAVITMPL